MAVRITPYLAVGDARGAIAWYRSVLGAEPVGDPIVMDDGRIGHAELAFGTAELHLSDAHPEIGVTAPNPTGSSVTVLLAGIDVDRLFADACAAGAAGVRPPADGPHGRVAVILDPFGHRWMLST